MILSADFFCELALHCLKQANDLPRTPARGPHIRARRAVPPSSSMTVRRLPAPRR